jgi:UDP-N-acetylmuramate--alanine ligase
MNIYFSGIGGVGVGPLAEIARDAGHSVIGSDLTESLTTTELREKGIGVNIGQDGSFLQAEHNKQPIDWFVYTAALPDIHPELVLARKLGIKTAKRDELLAQIISDKKLKLLAVSGTHGKTTTTGMLVWVFKQLGIPVSYSIGTTIGYGPSGLFDPASEYFVYECDEFDHNFLHFNPYLALIPAIDYDHPDTYANQQEYFDAFRQFAAQSEQVIAWNDQHGEIFEGLYQVSLLDPSQINETLRVHGHNRRNGTLVETAVKRLGITDDITGIIGQFPGTDRRFEKLAENLYSDYGHHPVEIASTLQLARELSDHVVLVYQPHQNIRQHQIKNEYVDQFELADDVYWLPTYLSREDPNLPILEPEELIKNINNRDRVHVVDFNDELWDTIQKARDEGKLVLGMGAGAIDGWLRQRLIQGTTR